MTNNSILLKIGLIILFLSTFLSDFAQSFEEYQQRINKEFSDYANQKQQEFEEYRNRINAEFAAYMQEKWPDFEVNEPIPIPELPEPPEPVIKDPESEPITEPIPFEKVKPEIQPEPKPSPQPSVPLPEPTKPSNNDFIFSFYGTNCKVPITTRHKFSLTGLDEKDISEGWKILSDNKYLPVVSSCLKLRDDLKLPDWGYVKLIEKLTYSFFPESRKNEAKLLQMYILTQSGYKVRMGKSGNNLVLFLPSEETIYTYPYLKIDGLKYYMMDKGLKNKSFSMFNRAFPKEQLFSLEIRDLPKLKVNEITPKVFKSDYDNILANVAVDKSLIDFYDDYPISESWDYYAKTPLSDLAKRDLYPILKSAIAGKSEREAANILLHFVQTAFQYATDDKQFGYERPLFSEESFYYPYNDCEDRAILYSLLVKELLDLDVVLLNWPEHIGTAVNFNENVTGSYLTVDGKKFVICDPTYINSNVGDVMPRYKNISAKVIPI